jgi:hypothetical protein
MSEFSYSSSWTDIANQALKTLQAKLINSLGDGSALANYCKQFMGEAVDLSLEEADWTGARKLALLGRLVETPAFGFAYYYQLPGDVARQETVGPTGITYDVVGDKIATDSETVEFTYIARPEDPAKLPAHLRNLIASNLAQLLTVPLTSSESTKVQVDQQHDRDLAAALRAEAKTRKDQELADEIGFTYYDELR